MRRFLLIIPIAIITLFSSCDDTTDCVRGGGVPDEINLELTDFEDIELAGAVNLELIQGPTFETILVVEPELLPALNYGVTNNTLFLGTKNGECISTSTTMVLKVTAPMFNEIFVAGASNIRSIGDLTINSLVMTVAGAVVSDITGTANSQVYNIDGSVDIDHFGIDSNIVTMNVNGSADMEVVANDALTLNINGGAVVRYRGNPQITQNVAGSLQLIDAN